MKRGVSIIVPAFNEGENIYDAVNGIRDAVSDAYPMVHPPRVEIILIDDGSTDTTGTRMDYLAEKYPGVRVLHHEQNRGLCAAYETGLAVAAMPYVVWLPGDGEMASESIADILRTIGTADLVVPYHGTPERRSWFRRLLTWGSTTQLNVLLGHRLRYFQGTVVYPTEMARRLPRTERGFFFCAEMLCHALEEGPSYVQVPLVHTDRATGVSKAVGWRQIIRAQCLIARLWFRITANRMALAAQFALGVGR